MKNLSAPIDSTAMLEQVLQIDSNIYGINYIKSIAKNIWETFGFKYILIGYSNKSDNASVQTLVFLTQGHFQDNFDYKLNHTPCENVFSGQRVCIYEKSVALSFPKDRMLIDMEVESYIGAPTFINGKLLGLVSFLDQDKVKHSSFYRTLVEFLASRISIEIERYIYKQEFEDLAKRANLDALTGLLNKRAFSQRVNQNKSDLERSSIIFIDADNFKKINDTCGHLIGDDVLCMLSGILTSSIRDGDIISRFGGEEFVIFLPKANESIAADIANRIHQHLANNELHPLTVSIGIATGLANETLENLIDRADKATYIAKLSGKNQTVVFNQKKLS